ncbi:DUF5691 domain-containing protein [Hymenobacter latericus]|uniref:DUF5691 domain-containing protein n=1 Tax=Hymenobacter sp. YIM 151858-1 TaxID=2987688 RepID=UPI002226E5A4|nr:DUF5691 domain-containing protein [Hymenobacter sp. YIM 151858-1]UYZ60012.1 DUF5691 domain-containing protein [Hymenobacter sp. YIM 151858-1]
MEPNLQSDWSQLLRVALLGTRQSGEPVPKLAAIPEQPELAREAQVLRAAGTLGLIRKAGFRAPAASLALPETAPAETLPALGPQGQDALRVLLSGSYPDVFGEYLHQLAQHGRRVPHHLLVPMLSYAAARPELRANTAAVMGERGRWLAGLNSAWAQLFGASESSEADWETGTITQRQQYLQHLRFRNAAQARELLAAALPQESARQQAILLGTLAAGLSEADAPLLEQYLLSKSKEVRQTVAPLLARLKGSALAERLWQRAQQYVRLKKSLLRGKSLEVHLPEVWKTEWQADGIEQKDARFSGEKAVVLGQLLALIAPERWAAHWEISPAKILELAAESEWASVLLTAWQQALLLHRSAEWARAYLSLQLAQPTVPPLTAPQAAALLNPAEFAQLLLEQLPRQPRFSQPEGRWEALLLNAPGPWPQALTNLALSTIGNTVVVPNNIQRYALSARIAQLLRHMQRAVPPAQYDLCATALHPLLDVEPMLNNQINQLLDTLQFRQQLSQTLTEPPAPEG